VVEERDISIMVSRVVFRCVMGESSLLCVIPSSTPAASGSISTGIILPIGSF